MVIHHIDHPISHHNLSLSSFLNLNPFSSSSETPHTVDVLQGSKALLRAHAEAISDGHVMPWSGLEMKNVKHLQDCVWREKYPLLPPPKVKPSVSNHVLSYKLANLPKEVLIYTPKDPAVKIENLDRFSCTSTEIKPTDLHPTLRLPAASGSSSSWGRVHVKIHSETPPGGISVKPPVVLWEGTYDLKGNSTTIDNKTQLISSSTAGRMHPACLTKGSPPAKLTLDVLGEGANLEVKSIWPMYGYDKDYDHVSKTGHFVKPIKPGPLETIINSNPNALLCHGPPPPPDKPTVVSDYNVSRERGPETYTRGPARVYLTPEFRKALIELDKTIQMRTESNPVGEVIHEIADGKMPPPPKNPRFFNQAEFDPTSIIYNNREEIRVEELHDGTFSQFDCNNPLITVNTAPPRFVGDLIALKARSPEEILGQSSGTDLHPAIKFKHPAHHASVRLVDLTDNNKLLWDAQFRVNGYRIAQNQKPIGGMMPKFKGICPSFDKVHFYSLKVDADSPSVDDGGGVEAALFKHKGVGVKLPGKVALDPLAKLFKGVKPKARPGSDRLQFDLAPNRRIPVEKLPTTTKAKPLGSKSTSPTPRGSYGSGHSRFQVEPYTRFFDNWRSAEFLFGASRPVTHYTVPLTVKAVSGSGDPNLVLTRPVGIL
jgi:hypothetical protein